MNQDMNHIFKALPDVEPSKDLQGKILTKIAQGEQGKMRRRKFALKFSMILSTIGSIWTIAIIGKQITNSDFWSIAQLSFTDFHAVLTNWPVFAWSLLETLPAQAFAMLLLPILTLMILGRIYNNQKNLIKFNSLIYR